MISYQIEILNSKIEISKSFIETAHSFTNLVQYNTVKYGTAIHAFIIQFSYTLFTLNSAPPSLFSTPAYRENVPDLAPDLASDLQRFL